MLNYCIHDTFCILSSYFFIYPYILCNFCIPIGNSILPLNVQVHQNDTIDFANVQCDNSCMFFFRKFCFTLSKDTDWQCYFDEFAEFDLRFFLVFAKAKNATMFQSKEGIKKREFKTHLISAANWNPEKQPKYAHGELVALITT